MAGLDTVVVGLGGARLSGLIAITISNPTGGKNKRKSNLYLAQYSYIHSIQHSTVRYYHNCLSRVPPSALPSGIRMPGTQGEIGTLTQLSIYFVFA